jgi:hypothetical protein
MQLDKSDGSTNEEIVFDVDNYDPYEMMDRKTVEKVIHLEKQCQQKFDIVWSTPEDTKWYIVVSQHEGGFLIIRIIDSPTKQMYIGMCITHDKKDNIYDYLKSNFSSGFMHVRHTCLSEIIKIRSEKESWISMRMESTSFSNDKFDYKNIKEFVLMDQFIEMNKRSKKIEKDMAEIVQSLYVLTLCLGLLFVMGCMVMNNKFNEMTDTITNLETLHSNWHYESLRMYDNQVTALNEVSALKMNDDHMNSIGECATQYRSEIFIFGMAMLSLSAILVSMSIGVRNYRNRNKRN